MNQIRENIEQRIKSLEEQLSILLSHETLMAHIRNDIEKGTDQIGEIAKGLMQLSKENKEFYEAVKSIKRLEKKKKKKCKLIKFFSKK